MRMFPTTLAAFGLSLALIGCAAVYDSPAAAKNMSHVHMGHVTTGWKDTPEGKGFLPTAIAEAKIAAQHAGFAAKKLDDLGWMQMHAHHVRHAVDASLEAKGPGLGYGVLKASTGAVKHINFAANSSDASKNVKAHSVHVSTSAENTIVRVKEIVALTDKVLTAKSAKEAAPATKQIKILAEALLAGVDANGDGSVSWKKGEGGLNVAMKHMELMAKGEKMN